MGPAAVDPETVRLPVPTAPCGDPGHSGLRLSRTSRHPWAARVAAVLNRSFGRRPLEEVQKGPDAVSSNLSDDDSGRPARPRRRQAAQGRRRRRWGSTSSCPRRRLQRQEATQPDVPREKPGPSASRTTQGRRP